MRATGYDTTKHLEMGEKGIAMLNGVQDKYFLTTAEAATVIGVSEDLLRQHRTWAEYNTEFGKGPKPVYLGRGPKDIRYRVDDIVKPGPDQPSWLERMKQAQQADGLELPVHVDVELEGQGQEEEVVQ